jgi:hypothetical protein
MFYQHVTGDFEVAIGGAYHCGPDDSSPKRLQFEVLVEYPDDALDERGFLIDNLTFQHYFNSIGYTTDSCELIAKHAGEYFCSLATKALWVYVNICVPGLACIKFKARPEPLAPPLAASAANLTLEDM